MTGHLFQTLQVGKKLTILAVLLMGFLEPAMANDNMGQMNLFDVDEKETQLAKKFAEREKEALPEFEYDISLSSRSDKLNWSIAIDDVNEASKVKWDELRVPQIQFSGKIMLNHDWFLEGYYSTGSINSGVASDTDYAQSGQVFLNMQSSAGGSVSDVSLAVGKALNIELSNDVSILSISPLLGLSFHQQKLKMTDGVQVYPTETSIPQLDNGYSAIWNSVWVGLGAEYLLQPDIELNALVKFHKASYDARANWNLRHDLKHPVSFEHDADGQGSVLSVGLNYYFTRNLFFGFHIERQDWETKKGGDRTFFSSGRTEYYTLNSVKWESEVYSLALGYQF
jgi:hypothetical protein